MYSGNRRSETGEIKTSTNNKIAGPDGKNVCIKKSKSSKGVVCSGYMIRGETNTILPYPVIQCDHELLENFKTNKGRGKSIIAKMTMGI